MPQIFKFGAYRVFFWSNEGKPCEPVHIHIINGKPAANATKLWITHSGKCLLCNNNSNIPPSDLRKLIRVIEANSNIIISRWHSYFGEISYYC